MQNVYLKGGDQLYLPYNDNKRIYVMGEVNQPRALSFKTATMNLTDVLGSVGGLSQTTSNGNAVYVIRGVENLDVEPAKIYQLEAESPTAMALASHFEVRPAGRGVCRACQRDSLEPSDQPIGAVGIDCRHWRFRCEELERIQ